MTRFQIGARRAVETTSERASKDFAKKWTRRTLGHKYIRNEGKIPGAYGMAGVRSREVLRNLNTLYHCGAAGQLGDEELLERFVAGGAEAAESAFEALVGRHGAMVLGVCRRVLGDRHEAEDAFQATFLVLARKAPAIARREQLASWLHGVARRAALDARACADRQRAREKRLSVMSPAPPPDQTIANELRSILDDELARLPERHRAAILLCELEGLSRREAASRLGVSEGTLSSRLARAKTRLRERLMRRGLALSTATLAAALAHDAAAVSVPAALADSTIRVAALTATGYSLAGVVSTSVVTLTEGVLKAMLLAKLKLMILGFLAVAVVTTGAGVLAQDGPSDEDRLKSVERKLDRLLEVLGGASRHAPIPGQRPAPSPTPAPTAEPAIAATGALPPGEPPSTSDAPPAIAAAPRSHRLRQRPRALRRRRLFRRRHRARRNGAASASHATAPADGRTAWCSGPVSQPRHAATSRCAARPAEFGRRPDRLAGTTPQQPGAAFRRIRAPARENAVQ